MAVRKHTQESETATTGNAKTAGGKSTAGDAKTAEKLSQGLTLVPYWGYSPDGRRVACCAWVCLKPGESLSQAASRLTAAGGTNRNPSRFPV